MTDTPIAPSPADRIDLAAIRGRLSVGTDDTVAPSRRRAIGLREVVLGPDALDALAPIVESLRRPGPIVVLMDATPMRRAGIDLKADAVARLTPVAPVRAVVLGKDRPELHADERALAEADAAIAGAGCVVSVGSGTVTDVAKDASHRAGGIPFVVVQTAVSVNAFSDDMAVLLRHGVKRTVPSRWPDALVIDLGVIADAPPELNRAGFGELTAMFTAPADWYLATALGHDDSYDPVVVDLYREGGQRLLACADGVHAGSSDALAEIARQMTMTGIAMAVAGRTAPLSGTEHTISHLLDMSADRDGRGVAFHGAQVGVAAVIVALAWRRVLAALEATAFDGAGNGRDDGRERRVREAFASLDGTGDAGEECWRDYARKLRAWDATDGTRRAFAAGWADHAARIRALVDEPERIVDALRRAGSPTRFSELDPAVPAATARWAVASCHLMRDRFTVADLVDLGGVLGRPWDAELADELLAEAADLGAGL